MPLSLNQKFVLLLARLGMGWLMLYAGILKILDSSLIASVRIEKATILPQFHSFLLQADALPYLHVSNKWVLVVIGSALLIGFAVRPASFLGLLLMVLYYLPTYAPQSIAIDERIVYAILFLILMVFAAGRFMGLDGLLERVRFVRKRPWMGKMLG